MTSNWPCLLQQALGGRHVEDGEGRAADRVDRAEPGDAGDGHRPLRPLAGHADLVPELVVPLLRAGGVDHDLAGPDRPLARTSASWGCAFSLGLESPAEVRAAGALPSCLPSRPISLTKSLVPLMSKIAPEALSTSGSAATFVCSDSGTVALAAALDDLLAGDHGAGVLVRALEEVVEGLLHRVRQDEGPAHHRDAEDDRQRGQRRAQLAARAGPAASRSSSVRQPLHRARARRARRGPYSSSTVSPSARKTIRSATAAALASCVTIIVVWP